MSEPYEITITAKGADGKESSQDFEYSLKSGEGNGPQQAVTDIVQSVSPDVASRIKTVSNGN